MAIERPEGYAGGEVGGDAAQGAAGVGACGEAGTAEGGAAGVIQGRDGEGTQELNGQPEDVEQLRRIDAEDAALAAEDPAQLLVLASLTLRNNAKNALDTAAVLDAALEHLQAVREDEEGD